MLLLRLTGLVVKIAIATVVIRIEIISLMMTHFKLCGGINRKTKQTDRIGATYIATSFADKPKKTP